MIKRRREVALGVALLVGSAEAAQAYLDPGTGSFFLQMVIGGIVGSLVAIKLYWTKIKLFFSTHKRPRIDSK